MTDHRDAIRIPRRTPGSPLEQAPGGLAPAAGRLAALALLLALAAPTVAASPAADGEDAPPATVAALPVAPLSPQHERFLRDVAPLITETEREVFLSLTQRYQREQFIRRFWRVRDPYPQTGRNELRESWEARLLAVRERFEDEDLSAERPRLMLALGVPTRVSQIHCPGLLRPLEIWTYAQGSERVRGSFTLIFIGSQPGGRGRHRLWYPTQGLEPLIALGARTFGFDERLVARAIDDGCARSQEILAGLSQALDLSSVEHTLFPKPPSDEWVLSLRARSTDMPEGAEPLAASLSLSFPGRHQNRTVVQGLVTVPPGAAGLVARGAYQGYSFLLDGEVLRGGELFEQFRYRFDLPATQLEPQSAAEGIPLIVQRYLRPGDYELIVKVEDLATKRIFRQQLSIAVPRVERRRPILAVADDGRVVTAAAATYDQTAAAAPPAGEEAVELTTPKLLDQRLAEANASIATGDHSVKLMRPPNVLTVGRLRVLAQTRGEGIAGVAFELDGKRLLKKSRPPWSVELDLGDKPRLHDLRAVALDQHGNVLAADEIVLNAGPHRFGVRLIEPQPGRRYRSSVRVHAEVEVPEGERLDRLELYLNETLLATLYQPPFEQPLMLRGGQELSWIRAAAYLKTGATAEDTVFINAPDFVDNLEVQMVELFTSVVDKGKGFVEGLSADDFEVFEEGVRQKVSRFELVRDLPIYAGIVLDTSLSMVEELRAAEKAAYRFLETVLTPRDRAAIITFNDAPTLQVRFTGDKSILAGGLAELTAEGETALYDTIIFALHYFSGLRGKRAIVILTDGEDSSSHYSFQDALEFAHHTGVALYVIALDLPSRQLETRMLMNRLARETGGGFFTVDNSAQLGRVYDAIQEELRSQYLLAYQSSHTKDDGFRRVEVKLKRKGLTAKTISGYFP